MTDRQAVFEKLRPSCVELSSVALKFKARLASNGQLLQAVQDARATLQDVARSDVLDPKLAEYCFFPLSTIFNEARRAPAQCLEEALRCLEVLITKGWAESLQAALAQQLLILLCALATGSLGQDAAVLPRSEELTTAAQDCIGAIFASLSDATVNVVFDGISSTSTVDQTVYVLLESMMESRSDAVQLSAVDALATLNSRIASRVVLASLLPRTVSSLTRVLTPTTGQRRSYFVLKAALRALRSVLEATMNDQASKRIEQQVQLDAPDLVLDESWRKATAGQIKMALANVIRVRTHDRWDVRQELALLCQTLCANCELTLADSIPMLVETLAVIASIDQGVAGSKTGEILQQLLRTSATVQSCLQTSLHSWAVALPRAASSDAFKPKERALQRLSFGFQALTSAGLSSDLLNTTLATALCDTAATMLRADRAPQQVAPTLVDTDLSGNLKTAGLPSFGTILAPTGKSATFSSDMRGLIDQICASEGSFRLAESLLAQVLSSSQETILAPYWVLVSTLKARLALLPSDTQVITTRHVGAWHELIDELYSFSLSILTDYSPVDSTDWRLPALALESVAMQAYQLRDAFAPELIDALYPILQISTTSHPVLKRHAMTCLSIVAQSCGYSAISDLLIGNVDYIVNSIGLKLNAFDVSPQAPQVLLLLIQLCGTNLIPFLDDLIGSIFAILDAYHGYPKLAETMYSVLRAIVAKGSAAAPHPAMIEDSGSMKGQTLGHVRALQDVVDTLQRRRERLDEVTAFHQFIQTNADDDIPNLPRGPLSSDMLNDKQSDEAADPAATLSAEEDDSEALPPPQEELEKLSTSHKLILSIVRSTPPHLASPSPTLRTMLLELMTTTFEHLSQHQDTFLPLINDLWPPVSARIALPAQVSDASLVTGDKSDRHIKLDRAGPDEDAYVFTAACSTIEMMIRTAGNFMSSRLEDAFPRWKALYNVNWSELRRYATQRHRQHSDSSTLVTSTAGHRGLMSLHYNPHYKLWTSFASLFATMLAELRLPTDMSRELCHMLGASVSFLQSRVPPQSNQTQPINIMSKVKSAMVRYDPDLTWVIFQQAEGKARPAERTQCRYASAHARMTERLNRLRSACNVDSVDCAQWSFGDMLQP
ncbi:hypothetical protein KEM52_000200 [Ascosphaera acerosa]|nr:hypothetical protein KEM52_000200 [Ascosphaera acerosa]